METLITILTNVLVPIAVALIRSGKLASKLERKFSVNELSSFKDKRDLVLYSLKR